MAWNRPNQDTSESVGPKSPLRGAWAGLIVVAGLAAAAFWLFGTKPAPASKDEGGRKARIADAAKTHKADAAASKTAGAAGGGDVTPGAADGHGLPAGGGDGTPTFEPPAFEPPVFSNATDQVLALLPTGDGTTVGPPPPMSRNFEAEFRKSLETPIVVDENDSPEVRAMKEKVIELRAGLKELLDQGQSVAQVLREHQELAKENEKIRTDAMIELKGILDSGDIEGAKKYKLAMNVALQQMGIAELSIPVTDEERAERAASRRERMLQKRAAREAAAELRHAPQATTPTDGE